MNSVESTVSLFEQHCLTVLGCYAIREAAAKTGQPEYNGWLDRIADVPGVESASLTSIHGYLIAQGLIRFEFTGRSVGLQYQLSPQGRDCLASRSVSLPDDHRSSDPAESQDLCFSAA